MKVAIQGLGEVPTTIELVLEKEKPDVTYILTSDFQLKYVAAHAGYKKANEVVIKKIGEKTGTKIVFKECDCFNPRSIAETITEILQGIDFFDLYRGKGIPDGKKSIAFRLRFSAPDRTLASEEVDASVAAVVERLSSLGATLRSV